MSFSPTSGYTTWMVQPELAVQVLDASRPYHRDRHVRNLTTTPCPTFFFYPDAFSNICTDTYIITTNMSAS